MAPLDETQGRPGPQSASQKLPLEGEGRPLALVLRVEVSDAVFAVEHADHDAEEDRNDRHVLILLLSRRTV